MVSKVSSLDTRKINGNPVPGKQSIANSKLEIVFESRRSNVICLVTIERSKSHDTISLVKLNLRVINTYAVRNDITN